jgi:cytochrome c2
MRLAFAAGALAALAAGASAVAQPISDAGERAFQFCFSCHSVEKNQTETLSGPNLNGVIGRPIASKQGFEYSPALKTFAAGGKSWTPELIAQFIQNPAALVPGTAMQRPPGPRTPEDRAALIEYLRKAH